jgi:glycosyltransferase involved in cell wall biosynthesis
MNYKKRILFVGEASNLSTGFSTYYRELLPRLAATGKFEIAEMGSYVRQDDPKVHEFIQGRWKFYGVMPMTQEEAQVFNQPSPHPRTRGQNTNQFGEYKFNGVLADFQPDVVIDIRDWWMCFTGDTSIVTENGSYPIKDVSVGDNVLTHKGRYRKVVNTFSRNYQGKLYTLQASHIGMPVTMTEGHPVLVFKRNNNKTTKLPSCYDIKPEWLPIEQVGKYDLVFYPIAQSEDSEYWKISEDLARLIGYYAAEGCLMYEGIKANNRLKGIQLTFGNHEIDYVQDVCDIIQNEFNIEAKVRHDDVNNTLIIRVFSCEVAKRITDFVSGTAKNKKFNGQIINADLNTITNVLCGVLRGDGCLGANRASYCTASETLANQVFSLLIKLGIMPSYNLNDNKLDGQVYTRYIFSIRGQSLEGFRRIYCDGELPLSKDKTRMNHKFVFLTVKDIRVSEGSCDVYNFEVEEDNSYVTSFAVHNCEYQERSVFRPWYKWIPMPTVDAEPQAEEWIKTYENADMVLAYSDYGVHALRRQSQLTLNGKRQMRIFPKAMRPGVDLETFKPIDKEEIREHWNLSKDNPVIGCVMRNQSRKLYPDLIDGFARMKEKYKGTKSVDKAVLLIHSSWPDNAHSYDYPRHIMRLETMDWMPYHSKGIRGSVLQSMFCHSCQEPSVTFAMNLHGKPVQEGRIKLPCPHCGKTDASPPATAKGFSREDLAKLYNLMDLYVQCSICEGDGMPIQEAKACGVPTLVTDYTAMREKGRYPAYSHFEELGFNEANYTCPKGGDVINVGRYYYEPETSCKRAHPDVEHLADQMHDLITDRERLEKMSREARECAEENYNWNILWKQWEYVLDNVKIKDRSETWDSPIGESETIKPIDVPNGLTDEQYVEWLYINVLKYPVVDPDGAKTWVQHLGLGVPRERLMQQFVQIGNQQSDSSKMRDQIRQQVSGFKSPKEATRRKQEFI